MSNNDPRLTYVSMSALICNEALTEMYFLLPTEKTKDEKELLDGPPFAFYRVALQYCFNSEYNKLLEPDKARDKKSPGKHIASLEKLNTNLYFADKLGFKKVYDDNNLLISSIVNTDFYRGQKELRDQKFSHSDQTPLNDPLQIKGLTKDEIEVGFDHLKTIYTIINNCANYFGFNYHVRVPYHDTRTRNFIKLHALYKKYYYDNYMEAISKGYTFF